MKRLIASLLFASSLLAASPYEDVRVDSTTRDVLNSGVINFATGKLELNGSTIESLLSAKQASDADLTALAALSGTNNIYYRSAANTWTSVTIGSGLSFSAGTLDVSGSVGVSDTAFASSWNGVTATAPSKNAVYDYIHLFDTDDDGKVNVLDLGAGIVKTNASGVVALATSGTDYAPATSGTSILKGDGSGGFSNAASGTDYAPATSGSSILYGNGSGAFSNVTVGTGLSFIAGTLTNTVSGTGTVTSVGLAGTSNQVTVTGSTPITTSGSWTLSIPSSAQLSIAKLTNLTTNGFVKTGSADGTLSVDTSTYLTSSNISDTAFASSWNGVTTISPSKNAIYDWAHTFDTDDDGKVNVLDLATSGLVKVNSSGVVAHATEGSDFPGIGSDNFYLGSQTFSAGPTIASAASATLDMFAMAPATVTLTGNTAITTATGFNSTAFYQPTFGAVSAITVSRGATIYIQGAPVSGGNVTFTNPYSLWIDSGLTRMDGGLAVGTGNTAPDGTVDAVDLQLSGVDIFPVSTANGGVKTGGTTGQVLSKASNSDYDLTWSTSGAGTGTVTSVGLAGTSNQITVTGSTPITSSGSWTLSVPASAQLDIAKLTNLTSNGFVKTGSGDGTLSIDTSTYLTTSSAASTYQPLDSDLTTLAGLTATTNNFIVSVGSAWASRTPSQVRTTLGLVIGTDVEAWDADLDTWATVTPATGVGTFLATPSSANLASAVTDETGTGALVFANSPALVTPTGIVKGDVGLGSVTNDAQTKAAVVPNTAPSSGQVLVGNAGGTAYAKQTLSGSGATATLNDSGVLTLSAIANATLSNSAITIAGTSTSLGGSITLDTISGVSSNGLLKRTGSSTWTNVTAPSGAVVGTTDTQTLSGKTITPRVHTTTSTTTFTPDFDTYDQECQTALAGAITVNAPTFTAALDGAKRVIRIKSDASGPHAFTWDGSFVPIGVTLPTTIASSKTIYVGVIYNANTSVWDAVAVQTQL